MIEIEQLSLRLPAGFEHRSSSIARLVGEALSAAGTLPCDHIESLTLPPLRAAPNASDGEIARQVANGITAQIHKAVRGQL